MYRVAHAMADDAMSVSCRRRLHDDASNYSTDFERFLILKDESAEHFHYYTLSELITSLTSYNANGEMRQCRRRHSAFYRFDTARHAVKSAEYGEFIWRRD